MYRHFHSVIIALLLAVALPGRAKTGADTVRVLAIGNSFSQDAIEYYLHDVAAADGRVFIVGNLYIGGAPLALHWRNMKGDLPAYSFRKIDARGVKHIMPNTRISDAVRSEPWEYITFQQVSGLSGIYDTYFPDIDSLFTAVRRLATNPKVCYALHATWAYAGNATHPNFAKYGKSQTAMYQAIVATVRRVAARLGVDLIIPSGTAVQNARTSFIGDHFCADGYHLNAMGRYTAACTWYAKLTGHPVTGLRYVPSGLSPRVAGLCRIAADNAVWQPFEVTAFGEQGE